MSRSYKKSPICKDHTRILGSSRTPKQEASRAVRRQKEIPNGNGYRKIYCSWDISDYKFIKSKAEFKQEWDSGDEYLHKNYKTYEQALFHCWKKQYKMK